MRISTKFAALGASSLVLMQPVAAEDRLAACRGLADGTARLKCYDEIANISVNIPSGMGNWQIKEDTSGLDKSHIVAIILAADKVTTHSPYGKNSSYLTIRCSEKTTSIYVSYSVLASNSRGVTPVRYRVGDTPPKSGEWEGSQDNMAYGLWSNYRSVPFIKELIGASDFFVRGEANVFGTTEAMFKLNGLSEAIKPVRATCNW